GWQDEERLQSLLAARQHLAPAEQNREEQEGVKHRPPSGETEIDHFGRIENLNQRDENDNDAARPDEAAAQGTAPGVLFAVEGGNHLHRGRVSLSGTAYPSRKRLVTHLCATSRVPIQIRDYRPSEAL